MLILIFKENISKKTLTLSLTKWGPNVPQIFLHNSVIPSNNYLKIINRTTNFNIDYWNSFYYIS